MKKSYVAFAATSVCLAMVVGSVSSGLHTPAHAQTMSNASATGSPNTITVSGAASEMMPASTVDVQISYTVSDATTQALLQDEQKTIAKLHADLAKLHLKADKLYVGYPNINNQQGGAYNSQMNATVEVPTSTEVANVIGVLSNLMDLTYISNFYTNETNAAVDESTDRARLFAAALSDAKAQATVLASDVGDTVGPVVSITTAPGAVGNQYPTYNSPYYNYNGISGPMLGGITAAYGGNGGVLSTQSEIATTVTVTYQLLQSS